MPIRGLSDWNDRRPPVRREHRRDWVSKAAFVAVIGYFILNSPWMWALMSPDCVRDNHPTVWQEDWSSIFEWKDFVEQCSNNFKRSHDGTGFLGDAQGDSGHNPYFVYNTRCVTTAYALINYFCGSDDIAQQKRSMFHLVDSLYDSAELDKVTREELVLDAFIQTVNDSVFLETQNIYRLYIDQNFDKDHLGHVWVVQSLPNGTFNWYQSFIGKYTLHDWMRKGSNFMSKQELLKRMELIRGMIVTEQWTEAVNTAYFKLFDVDYAHMIGKEISPSIFGAKSGFDNTFHFDWALECQASATQHEI